LDLNITDSSNNTPYSFPSPTIGNAQTSTASPGGEQS